MTKRIAIIGAGTAGLHLGLLLRQHDIPVTIITDRKPADMASGRLLNTVAHHHVTLAREKALGIDHWPAEEYGYFGHDHYVGGPQPMQFWGSFSQPSRAVDYRIYLPQLMNDFVERGGDIRYQQVTESQVSDLSREFDLIVVGTGKGVFGQMFKHITELSPYEKPQRALCVGLYKGVAPTQPRSTAMSSAPGQGELIAIPTLTFSGMSTALLMENVHGGDLEVLARLNYEADPNAFLDTLLAKLEKHHPTVYERIDQNVFDLCQPLDILQGGVVPTVRQPYTELANGRFAIAVGDVQSVVDPVVGQGANMASYSAWVLGHAIINEAVYDKRFCEKVERERQDRILAASKWTNAMLAPPSEAFLSLLAAMEQNQDIRDEFTENFSFPERQWDRLASDERIHAWLAEAGAFSQESVPQSQMA
ncbi:hypothetical protein T5B8_03671 [Salinisphaera sp. T5B8]|uniref:styrene monooxygenase subunit StyA n=1 Tax=Salinisphaera sp. T5B8 TaxID=1304154 RepID=UPI0033411901